MKKTILLLLSMFMLCGCAEHADQMTDEQLARMIAYRFPKPPVIQTTIDSEELVEAFGDVAQGVKIVEKNINGWHKVQIIYDYPGGVPDNWEEMCSTLAEGTDRYKTSTTVELVTSRGALLASAAGGKLKYDAFEHVHEPERIFTHEGDLTEQTDMVFYTSSKNGYYHIDGTCGPRLSRVYYKVDANAAVDERATVCPICGKNLVPDEIKDVERLCILPEPREIEGDEEWEPVSRDISNSYGRIVYVSRNHIIHSISDCSGMKKYTEMTQEEADEKGYKYCENCW